MMKRIVLISIFVVYVSCDLCNYSDKFVSRQKAQEMEKLLNDLRNKVAMAKEKNHDKQLKTAANMHYVIWDENLGKKAQDCADKCPTETSYCPNATGEGYVIFVGPILQGGYDWNAQHVVHKWHYNSNQARQIFMGDVQKFGCGRVQKKGDRSLQSEIIVCFFNRKVNRLGDPYQEGYITQRCLKGHKEGYLGLCKP